MDGYMSLSDAVIQMLNYLDALVGDLPAPLGNTGKLPGDLVLLRDLKKNQNGIGKVAQESPRDNKLMEEGQFLAGIDIQLWSSAAQDVAVRSRYLVVQLLAMGRQKTANGIFRQVDLSGASGPEYLDDGKLWRISIGITLTFEYRFEEIPGTGIIDQIPVGIKGDVTDDFIVKKP